MKQEGMEEQALSGLKVLDLTHFIAGPYCTKLMADIGAEIIKVERPGQGDGARALGPFSKDEPHPEKSGLFFYLNTNKKSITLNLKTETGVGLLKELAKDANVIVENFEPRVMPSLGLSYEELKGVNPRLVMASISNFGQTGPYRDYKATNLTIMALGGTMAITGDEHRPLKPGGSQAEYMAGLMGFSATMIALLWQEETGLGQHVDLSIMECIAGNMEGATTEYPYLGVIRRRMMQRFTYGHPVGLYPCKDGYVIVIPGLGGMESLAMLLGDPGLMEHELFQDARLRQQRAQEFDELFLLPYLKEHTKKEIFEQAQELRMPFGYAQTIDELLDDVQLQAREFFVKEEHPLMGDVTYPGPLFRMGETSWKAGRPPLLGEHNEEIYCQRLGYTKEDLVKLRERRII